MLRLCHRLRRRANVALAVSVGAVCTAPAFAEGVVIQSSSDTYPRGAIVAAGEAIVLTQGETVTILDKSGEIETFEASGHYGDEDAGGHEVAAREFPIVEAAVWNRQRPTIGGTREFDFAACVEAAEARDDLTLSDCERMRRQVETGPKLELGFTGYASTRKPGESLHLSLKTNFEAQIACDLVSNEGEAERHSLPIGLRGATDYHLRKGLVVFLPSRGAPAIQAPETPGAYAIECRAVDVETLETFEVAETWLDEPRVRGELLETFARLRGSPFVRAELTLQVRQP